MLWPEIFTLDIHPRMLGLTGFFFLYFLFDGRDGHVRISQTSAWLKLDCAIRPSRLGRPAAAG